MRPAIFGGAVVLCVAAMTVSVPVAANAATGGSLVGKVREYQADALPDITVRLFSGDETVAATSTDENGRYSFTDLAPGEYTVKFVDTEKTFVRDVPAGVKIAYHREWAGDVLKQANAEVFTVKRSQTTRVGTSKLSLHSVIKVKTWLDGEPIRGKDNAVITYVNERGREISAGTLNHKGGTTLPKGQYTIEVRSSDDEFEAFTVTDPSDGDQTFAVNGVDIQKVKLYIESD